jgi:hypothetical protein
MSGFPTYVVLKDVHSFVTNTSKNGTASFSSTHFKFYGSLHILKSSRKFWSSTLHYIQMMNVTSTYLCHSASLYVEYLKFAFILGLCSTVQLCAAFCFSQRATVEPTDTFNDHHPFHESYYSETEGKNCIFVVFIPTMLSLLETTPISAFKILIQEHETFSTIPAV